MAQALPTSQLLVPVHLDAYVSNGNGLHKDLSPNLDNLKNYSSYGGLGGYVEKDTIPNNNTAFYSKNPGVHLHWVLPKSFRHGVHNKAANSLEFPLVPNRWLVVRYDAQSSMKAWMVESDFIDQNATENFNWIQVSEVRNSENAVAKKYNPVKIGRATDLSTWTENHPKSLFLTAIAPGDPSFAAAYLHSQNVFGFHDKMENVAENTLLNYQVFGWFSNAAVDPLSQISNIDDLKKKLAELSWSLDGIDSLASTPNSILCHAGIHSVLFNQSVQAAIPALNTIQLSIGNSTSEALGAMLSDRISGDQLASSQKLLAAFQYKTLKDNGLHQNGLEVLKKEIHKRSFNKIDSGSHWVIEQKEKDQDAIADQENQPQIAYTRPFSKDISDRLVELNSLQATFDASADDLKSWQEQLYAALYKKNYAAYGADTSMFSDEEWEQIGGEGGLLDREIAECKKEILALSKVLKELKQGPAKADEGEWPTTYTGKIPEKFTSLVAALKNDFSMADYELKELPNTRFYQATEPSVIINGLKPAEKYTGKYASTRGDSLDETGESNNLVCRLPSALADAIKIEVNGNQYTVSAEKLLPLRNILALDPKNVSILKSVPELLQESALLYPAMADAIASLVKNDHGHMTAEEFKALKTNTSNIIRNFTSNPDKFLANNTQATLPQVFSLAKWQQPWIPLHLEWAVKWTGDSTTQNHSDYLSNWVFGTKEQAADYALKSTRRNSNAQEEYSGRTILSADMVNKVEALNKKLGGDSSAKMFQTLKPMSQDLSGLFSQLINRYHGIQLPPLDEDLTFNSNTALLGGRYPWSPVPAKKEFFPFRAGMFSVSMLRVIDAYGQVLEVITPGKTDASIPTFKNASALPAVTLKKDTYFVSPPRIIQPARIRFDWLSANIPGRLTDSDPATNPVCGWLLVNRLNNSIMVFDTAGLEIGELKQPGDTVKLIPPPGGTESKLKNARLNKLLALAKKSPKAFKELLAQLTKITSKVQSRSAGQLFSMALPIGYPVAVAGAECTLEVKGIPARSQYWAANGTEDLKKVTFKAYLGDVTSSIDGLAAYFTDNEPEGLSLPYLDERPASSSGFFREGAALALKLDEKIDLTLLLDPRSEVSITSGILPSAKYSLPQHAVLKPLRDISLRFLTAPLITPISKLKVPLMQSQDSEWSWIAGSEENVMAAPQVPDPNTKELLTFEKICATEGWLKLSKK